MQAESETGEAGQPTTRLLVITPTYNERGNIVRLIESTLAISPYVSMLVVDDSSPDGTGELAEQATRDHPDRVFVLHRPDKQGIGRAYLAGFDWALQRDYTHIATMDADFSHNPADLMRMLDATADADLALGSRYVEGGSTEGWPRARKALSWGGGHYARIVLGVPIKDLTGGFKLYRQEALEALPRDDIRSDGYVFQIETTYRIWEQGLKVVEVPIRFVDRVAGKSKLSRRIVFEAIVVVWRLRLQRYFR